MAHSSHRIEDITDQPFFDDSAIAKAVTELKGFLFFIYILAGASFCRTNAILMQFS